MKVIGSEVTPVNISTGQEMNAKVLLGIATQGPVYIRAMRSLPVQYFYHFYVVWFQEIHNALVDDFIV